MSVQKKYALFYGLDWEDNDKYSLSKFIVHLGALNCKLLRSWMSHSVVIKSCKHVSLQAEEWIAKGDYIVRELEALYMLKKYRTLKRRYYKEES